MTTMMDTSGSSSSFIKHEAKEDQLINPDRENLMDQQPEDDAVNNAEGSNADQQPEDDVNKAEGNNVDQQAKDDEVKKAEGNNHNQQSEDDAVNNAEESKVDQQPSNCDVVPEPTLPSLSKETIITPNPFEGIGDQIDLLFEGLAKKLIEQRRFNHKLVTEKVTKFKKYTHKAHKTYFNFFKRNIDDFLNEEERIYEEVCQAIEQDEQMSDNILKLQQNIVETFTETEKLLRKSQSTSQTTEKINQRIQAHETMIKLLEELETYVETSKRTLYETQGQA